MCQGSFVRQIIFQGKQESKDIQTEVLMMIQTYKRREVFKIQTYKRKGRKQFLNDCDIPDWLLIEILQRLPLKSIFRFKIIPKRWYSLISGCSYTSRINNDLLLSWSQPWTLLFREYKMGAHATINQHPEFSSPCFSLRFLPAQEKCHIIILASSNGLLLCSTSFPWHNNYYVCNPVAMQWVSLPRPLGGHGWLDLDIGFISQDDGYKVVHILDSSPYMLNLEIFSSDTGEWKESRVPIPVLDYFLVVDCPAVAYNGILHWLEFANKKIIAYDPNNNIEHCRILDLPRGRQSEYLGILGVCHGHLRYIEVTDIDEPLQPSKLSVWMLENYDTGEWCLVHRTPFGDMVTYDPYLSDRLCLSPRAIHPFDSDIVYLGRAHCIVSYNLRMRRLEIICHNAPCREVLAFVLPPSITPMPISSW